MKARFVHYADGWSYNITGLSRKEKATFHAHPDRWELLKYGFKTPAGAMEAADGVCIGIRNQKDADPKPFTRELPTREYSPL